MLRVATYLAKAGMREQAEVESLISYLRSKGYLPVIRSMLTGLFKLADLPEPRQALTGKVFGRLRRPYTREYMINLGDIFFTDDSIYTLIPMGIDKLRASAICYTQPDDKLKEFCEQIEESIRISLDGRRVRGMEFEWKCEKLMYSAGMSYRDAPYRAFYDEESVPSETEFDSTEPTYTPEDSEAANNLQNSEIRGFIVKLAQVGKITEKNAAEIVKQNTLQKILSLGLLVEECLLTCKQDQHTICVVSKKEDIGKEPLCSARCSICGRALLGENIQVIYTLSETAKKLATGSLWMSIWITELLKKSGVKEDTIRWGLEANGEELDIMVEDFGSRIFWSLKTENLAWATPTHLFTGLLATEGWLE